MARVDEDPEDRNTETVKVSQIVECDHCGTEFDAVFDTGEYDLEMVDSEISATVTCPKCSNEWEQMYEGWTAHTEAG